MARRGQGQGHSQGLHHLPLPRLRPGGPGPDPRRHQSTPFIASYAKDFEIIVFNGHVHTTEMYEVDGVKYLMLGGGGAEQDPILPGRTSIKVPGGLSAGPLLEGPAAEGGVQLRPGRRSTRPEDEVHPQSLPAVVGRAVRHGRSVHLRRRRRCDDGDSSGDRPRPGRGRAARRDHSSGAWRPGRRPCAKPGSFLDRFRSVPPVSFANAIIVLYLAAAVLGAIVYLISASTSGRNSSATLILQALGLFDLKEHFISIGLGLLPAYWVAGAGRSRRTSAERAPR